MFTYIPLRSSNLSTIESAFYSSEPVVAVGLGAKSRATKCYQSQGEGMCWGEFSGENTKFVNRYDHPIQCAVNTQQVHSAQVGRGEDRHFGIQQTRPATLLSGEASLAASLLPGVSVSCGTRAAEAVQQPRVNIYNQSLREDAGAPMGCANCNLSRSYGSYTTPTCGPRTLSAHAYGKC